MQNFGQSGPKNHVFLPISCSKFAPKSIHQIAWFQLQKYKIFQLLREAHPPSGTSLCVLTRHQIIPPMSKMDLRPGGGTIFDRVCGPRFETPTHI